MAVNVLKLEAFVTAESDKILLGDEPHQFGAEM
jgi:hypothetical protein